MNLPRAAFGNRARSYDNYAVVQRDAAEWLAEWLPPAGEFSRCLEFGAGTGLFTQHLMGRFEDIEVTDKESAMVEQCRRRHAQAIHRIRDAWINLEDHEKWDFIAAASLMQWAPDPVRTLENWSRSLNPGGNILIGFFASPSLPEVTGLLPDGGPVHWRTPDEWAALVGAANARLIKAGNQTRRYHYPNALALWKSLHRTGAIVSRRMAPSQMMGIFREYEARYSDSDGVYATWTLCRMLIAAPE